MTDESGWEICPACGERVERLVHAPAMDEVSYVNEVPVCKDCWAKAIFIRDEQGKVKAIAIPDYLAEAVYRGQYILRRQSRTAPTSRAVLTSRGLPANQS